MSFAELDAVFREAKFRHSFNYSAKRRIRKFLCNPNNARFTLARFCRHTGVEENAEALLNAIVARGDVQGKEDKACETQLGLSKTTEYLCPNVDHRRIVLESKGDGCGWCYLCTESYSLDGEIESEVVFTSSVRENCTSDKSFAGIYPTVGKHWQSLPSPVKWIIGLMVTTIIAIPITELFTPIFHDLISALRTATATVSPDRVHQTAIPLIESMNSIYGEHTSSQGAMNLDIIGFEVEDAIKLP